MDKRTAESSLTIKNHLIKILPVICLIFILSSGQVHATTISDMLAGEGSDSIRIVILMTLIAVIPSILLMMTCFGRIIIVLSFLRNALGLQQTPPNQILVGLALATTLFIMSPVFSQINEVALQPYSAGTVDTQTFLTLASDPMKEWMLKQTTSEDVNLFLSLSSDENAQTLSGMDLPMTVVIPAFIISELKRAFLIGFLIYIPFMIIDMIVASVLMSMGMMMLPPVMISLPFKVMLFVVVDGWGLLIRTLVMTYN
ncbi:MAG: flagellar biosynthesis protein FliP [Eubacteriaceae bacterium]|jgi:flagellar biosynthetic protein FliP|nr:flagellar biosynthesis protein FliP [Eubacteriaceae bacterium]MDK2936100.1 flagellar biosynthesis protein FliP [Eubacteriaceae bacterium]MDN5307848.1 flagellar biosynthesis protein FliP [Eubacteriaceae bacterium]